jgi:hypothetical protein
LNGETGASNAETVAALVLSLNNSLLLFVSEFFPFAPIK